MVHSTYAQGHVMGGRGDTSPLGIPKSPSFHSGLDLVAASSDSLKAAFDLQETTGFPSKISFYGTAMAALNGAINGNTPVTSVNGTVKGPTMAAGFNGKSPSVGNGPNMKNALGFSHVLMQQNSSAVRSMQAMGHLPLLKGT